MSSRVKSRMMNLMSGALALGIAASWGASALAADGVIYVQAVKAELKSEPKMSGGKVAELKRGDTLQIVKKDSIWYHVKSGSSEGWISRLFVSEHKPIGNAELNEDVTVSVEKASRKRSSNFSVTAATRGLSASDRVRGGREMYRSDFDAVKEMEAYRLPDGALDKFQRDAKLAR